MNKNKLIVGPIGSGKTTNYLFKNVDEMIDNYESLVIIDNNPEYLSKFKGKLESENYLIKTINFNSLRTSDKFNIFEYPFKLYQDKNYDDVMNILEIICKYMFESESSSDPFWQNAASDLFKCILLSLFDKGNIDNITLDKIQDIIVSPKLKEYFDNIREDGLAYRVGEYIIHAPLETKGGIISACVLGLGRLTTRPNLLNIISSSDINIEKYCNQRVAIFIIVDDIIKTNKIVTNIFLYELYYLLYKNDHELFNIIIDDINLVLPLEKLYEMIKNSSIYNVFFNVSALDLDEFNNIYGEQVYKLFKLIKLGNK